PGPQVPGPARAGAPPRPRGPDLPRRERRRRAPLVEPGDVARADFQRSGHDPRRGHRRLTPARPAPPDRLPGRRVSDPGPGLDDAGRSPSGAPGSTARVTGAIL